MRDEETGLSAVQTCNMERAALTHDSGQVDALELPVEE